MLEEQKWPELLWNSCVLLFLGSGWWGGGITVCIAQYVSYGSLVVFVKWATELYSYSSTYGWMCI